MELAELARIRRNGTRALAAVIWVCVAIVACGVFFTDQGWTPLFIAVAFSILPSLLVAQGRADTATRLVFGISLPLYPAILLYQWAGDDWQIDIHMLFFALIATLATLCDWRPIVAATILTALHHLGADLLMPIWVFDGGADLPRVALHAIIVLVEAGVLIQVVVQLERMIRGQAAAREEAAQIESEASRERETAAADQTLVIGALGVSLKSLSRGDLTNHLNLTFPPAYEALKLDYNAAIDALNAALEQVNQGVAAIDGGAGNISQASVDLSRRTELQAASLEETVVAMSAITDSVSEATDVAARAEIVASAARQEAEQSGAVVELTIGAMQGIQRSSTEISAMVAVIDGIAFQTNLLALNAGVEAARAGHAGAGFAVVASEVRALALRSAAAAEDIKSRITASSDEVRTGVRLVGETGQALSIIIGRIRELTTLVSSIAESAGHQSNGLRRLGAAVSAINRVTRQNAEMAEKASAGAQNLAAEANTLNGEVMRFKLQSSHRTPENEREKRRKIAA